MRRRFGFESGAGLERSVGRRLPQGAGFTVSVGSVSEIGWIGEYIRKAESDLREMFDGFHRLVAEERRILGCPAAWMEYTYRAEDETVQELNVTVFLGKTERVPLQVICESSLKRFDDLRPVFENTILNLEIRSNILRLPRLLLAGAERCAECGLEFGEHEEPECVMDIRRGGIIPTCERCCLDLTERNSQNV
ncbi:hypothetical protein JW916_00580 [Candidatus Sumerlaeota bacterium]|nr:hypothetical protein [Candidatus Sumerlaeota bacterium]